MDSFLRGYIFVNTYDFLVYLQKLILVKCVNQIPHLVHEWLKIAYSTAQKMKLSITDFFSKCDQIRSFPFVSPVFHEVKSYAKIYVPKVKGFYE